MRLLAVCDVTESPKNSSWARADASSVPTRPFGIETLGSRAIDTVTVSVFTAARCAGGAVRVTVPGATASVKSSAGTMFTKPRFRNATLASASSVPMTSGMNARVEL